MSIPARPDDRRCTAKAKNSGQQCKRWAIPGGTVCATHGGNSPVVRAAAERRVATRVAQADAAAVLAHEGITAIEDPLDELGKLASEARALTTALARQVNALDDVENYDAKRAVALRPVVELYERAMDRTHRMLDSLVKHGYMERQVRIQEQEALLVAGVIKRVLAGIGLSEAQLGQAQQLLAEEFRALEQQTR